MGRNLLNVGCGLVAPSSWSNYDGSLHAQLVRFPWLLGALHRAGLISGSNWPENVRYLNLNRPWPFPRESADVVYASHVLEHLTESTAVLFLTEAKRVLRPDGVLRLVVPDLGQHARRYIDDLPERGGQATAHFLASMNLGTPREHLIRTIYAHFTGHPHVHKTMYDEVTLLALVRSCGFGSIALRKRAESDWIPEIVDVEGSAFNDYADSLYIDARIHLSAISREADPIF